MTDELKQAILVANRFLDKPYADPDGDECLLARQFLRQNEKLAEVERATREECAREIDKIMREEGYQFGGTPLAERIRQGGAE